MLTGDSRAAAILARICFESERMRVRPPADLESNYMPHATFIAFPFKRHPPLIWPLNHAPRTVGQATTARIMSLAIWRRMTGEEQLARERGWGRQRTEFDL